jgi:hypothetical protein
MSVSPLKKKRFMSNRCPDAGRPMTTSRAHQEAVAVDVRPPCCDCCGNVLEVSSYTGWVVKYRYGIDVYCDPCRKALDRWWGAWSYPDHGLPSRGPAHFSAHRIAEIDEIHTRYRRRLVLVQQAKRHRQVGDQ